VGERRRKTPEKSGGELAHLAQAAITRWGRVAYGCARWRWVGGARWRRWRMTYRNGGGGFPSGGGSFPTCHPGPPTSRLFGERWAKGRRQPLGHEMAKKATSLAITWPKGDGQRKTPHPKKTDRAHCPRDGQRKHGEGALRRKASVLGKLLGF
jgi:hypothetical protein